MKTYTDYRHTGDGLNFGYSDGDGYGAGALELYGDGDPGDGDGGGGEVKNPHDIANGVGECLDAGRMQ
jgi:hypothetical protein